MESCDLVGKQMIYVFFKAVNKNSIYDRKALVNFRWGDQGRPL